MSFGFGEVVKTALTEVAVSAVRGLVRFSPGTFYKAPVWRWAERNVFWRPNIAKRTVSTMFGHKVDVQIPDLVQTTIYLTGTWEPAITGYVESQLHPGDVFVDVGSNIGYYALLASKLVGQQGVVYAIEASPSMFLNLERNISRNRAANVMAINAIASGQTGEKPFWVAPASNLGHSTSVASLAEDRGMRLEGTVRAAPLADLVPADQLFSARFIKIDVEGAEAEVLEPIFPLLKDFSIATEWLVELNSEYCAGGQGDVDRIFAAFMNAQYKAFRLPNGYDIADLLGKPYPPELIPLIEAPVEQADVLFTRSK